MTDSSAAGHGRDFFISYAGADRAWAEWIAVELERAGYSTFIQAFDFVPGSDFVHLMQKAGAEAQRTIAVLSGAYFNSQFGEAEWRVAFAKDPSGEHGLLLPVRVEACQVPGLLQTRVYVDLVAVTEEVARGKLLAAIDRNRPRPTSARFPGEAPPRSTVYPGTHVDASQARGVVVGDNANVVNNFWDTTASPRNDLALGKLSPQVSAQRLLGLPHLEAVAALAHAPIRAAVDVLRVILRREPSRAIGMIADLHPEGVTALVRELTAGAPYLADLPDAVEALEKCQDAMGWTIDQATTEVHRAQRSEAGTDGFFRAYQGGHLHWSASGGAHATVGAMIRGHAHHGGSAGLLGFPVSDETAAGRSPFGTEGTFQRFEFAFPYPAGVCRKLGTRCGATLYRSEKGVFATWGGIGEFYEYKGGTGGWLGFPVAHEQPEGADRAIQRFEGGTVTWTEVLGAIAMPAQIAQYYHDHVGVLGYPVSGVTALQSPSGTNGRCQYFDDGSSVYASNAGAFSVLPWINAYLGGEISRLGFPTGELRPDPWLGDSKCLRQSFEQGVIFFEPAAGAVTVSAEIMKLLDRDDGRLLRMVGAPISDERPTLFPGTSMQWFSNGIVTVTAGTPEVWIRPPTRLSGG